LRYAAAVEQGSSHLLGRVVVDAATSEGVSSATATSLLETAGKGVCGIVEGHTVRVGARSYVHPHCDPESLANGPTEDPDATLRAYVEIDGRLAAILEFADELRPELPALVESLHRRGIDRLILLSGDHAAVTRSLGASAGIHEAYGDLLPGDKAKFVSNLRDEGRRVMMIGDGINDAPALSAANVGVALAGHGGGITAEAADVIILVDSLDRVADSLEIASRTMRIARQSLRVGLGLSVIAMIAAALGVLPPLAGALLQEGIDVAVILNALRSSRDGSRIDSLHAKPFGEGRAIPYAARA
jgi:P-type E1-E2 ATPase